MGVGVGVDGWMCWRWAPIGIGILDAVGRNVDDFAAFHARQAHPAFPPDVRTYVHIQTGRQVL